MKKNNTKNAWRTLFEFCSKGKFDLASHLYT